MSSLRAFIEYQRQLKKLNAIRDDPPELSNRKKEMSNRTTTEEILNAREATHGGFNDVAWMAQSIKETIRTTSKWDNLSTRQKEPLDLIATKMARIVCGNPDHADHWDDIAGYAHLGGARLTRLAPSEPMMADLSTMEYELPPGRITSLDEIPSLPTILFLPDPLESRSPWEINILPSKTPGCTGAELGSRAALIWKAIGKPFGAWLNHQDAVRAGEVLYTAMKAVKIHPDDKAKPASRNETNERFTQQLRLPFQPASFSR